MGGVGQAREVREEDAFDVEAVDRWLREHAAAELEAAGEEPPEVRQFSGGASNLTYLLRYPGRELILRRPPPGVKAASAHDMAREFFIQKALAPVFPCVPEMVALCQDEAVIGSDFYVMERVKGTILRSRIPPRLGLDRGAIRQLCESAVDKLVELHAVDVTAAGLESLGKGPGYVRRQVEGWSERYRAAHTWNVPRFERVMAWLAERQPPDVAMTVVHNDYRFDNLVLAPANPQPMVRTDDPQPTVCADDPQPMVRPGCRQRIVAILDWEMATVGDPLMDLGGALAYWAQADDDFIMRGPLRRQPTDAPGMLTRAEVVTRYAERSGLAVEDWAFYEVFGLFRLATIIQQIYKRYHLRQTRNPAFRHYWLAVRYLNWRCSKIARHAR